jgi:hypothetical protein
MRKWITRTAGAVLIGAAFTAAGTGIANADSAGTNQRFSLWETLLSQAVGPVKNVCNDIAERTSRINTAACGALPKGRDDAPPATTNQRPPADPQPANQQPQQQTAPQPSDQGSGGMLGNNKLPLLGDALQGLGIG